MGGGEAVSGRYGTKFIESEILLGAQAKDFEYVEEKLREMLPGERSALIEAMWEVDSIARRIARER
jgi:hypothetical protein